DNTVNTLDGDITAADGATGVVVTGDDTRTTINGDVYASGGATGLTVSGNAASVTNQGSITAVDSGSTGVAIDGNTASFTNTGTIDSSLNGTGVSITGNSASVTLDGTVNVHAEKDADGVYQGATGVSVAGNDGTTEITGNVNVSGGMQADDINPKASSTLTGAQITGNNNTLTIDGSVNLSQDNQLANVDSYSYGLSVEGSGNNVFINSGVNIDSTRVSTGYDDNLPYAAYGIAVSGDNTVQVSGNSSVKVSDASAANAGLAVVTNGGKLILDSGSVLDVSYVTNNTGAIMSGAIIQASGSGSTAENKGVITTGLSTLMRASDNGTVINEGTITASDFNDTASTVTRAAILRADDAGSRAINETGGVITISSPDKPIANTSNPDYPIVWHYNTAYALLASNYGIVENDAGATINLNGAGLYGVAAAKGTATNAGTINVDGFIPTLDEDGNITAKTFYSASYLPDMSAGVIVGSTDAGNGDATGLNTGTINVNNEGFGMLALNGGTVTNQGTINLTADEGVEKSADNQLIGMGVINGGTAINDESGVININA
ncbi:BigA family surface-exposed virulence protein, partial [Trabulsiella guamensis ATCC 49490]